MEAAEKSLKILAKGGGIAFAGLMFSKIFGYAYRIIVARLGTEEYGLISLGFAAIGFLTILSRLGFEASLSKFIPEYLQKGKEKLYNLVSSALKLTLFTSILLATLLFIAANQVAGIFDNLQLAPVLRVMALALPIIAVRNTLMNVARARERMDLVIYSKELGENIFKVALTLIFIFLGAGVLGAAWAYVLAMVISAVIITFLIKDLAIGTFKALKEKSKYAKELLTFSWPLLFNNFLIVIVAWVDTAMLGIFKTTSDVGIYNAAMPTAMLMSTFPKSIIALFLPIISGLYIKKEMNKIKDLYLTCTKWILIIDGILLALFISVPRQIITLLFGQDYAPGAFALVILSTGLFTQGLILLNSRDILVMLGKTKKVFRITLISVILDILLNLMLIPRYGINGAAAATSTALIVMALLFGAAAQRRLKVQTLNKYTLRISIVIMIMTGILYLISKIVPITNIVTLALLVVAALLVYIFLVLASRALDKRDVEIITLMMRKAKINSDAIAKLLNKFTY